MLLSSDNQAYVAHFRPRGIDIARGWPDQEISTARNLLHREDLVMFALSTMQQDIEAIEKSAEREGVKISGFYKGVYEHVYDEKRDDVVMKAEEKDILVLPEERIVRLYREYSERLEFKL